jgi:hypothetical protein
LIQSLNCAQTFIKVSKGCFSHSNYKIATITVRFLDLKKSLQVSDFDNFVIFLVIFGTGQLI